MRWFSAKILFGLTDSVLGGILASILAGILAGNLDDVFGE
jgi:hypothetical protein